jgi:hypothetical protein
MSLKLSHYDKKLKRTATIHPAEHGKKLQDPNVQLVKQTFFVGGMTVLFRVREPTTASKA